MNLKKNNLINLPVYTQSNQHLGRVCDFEVDPATQMIMKYYVRSGGLIKEFLQKELLVSKDQVVSITTEKMVVEDGLVAEDAAKKEPARGTLTAG